MVSSLHKAIVASAALAFPSCHSFKGGAGALEKLSHGSSADSAKVAAEVSRIRSEREISQEFKARYPKAAKALEAVCEAQLANRVSLSLDKQPEEISVWRLSRLQRSFTDALVKDLADAHKISGETARSALTTIGAQTYSAKVEKILNDCGLTVSAQLSPVVNGARFVSILVVEMRKIAQESSLYSTVKATEMPEGTRIVLQELITLASTDEEHQTLSAAGLAKKTESEWNLTLNRSDINALTESLKVDRKRCEETVVAGLCGWLIGQRVVRDAAVVAKAKELDIKKEELVRVIQHYYGVRFGDAGVSFGMLFFKPEKGAEEMALELITSGLSKAAFSSSERVAVLEEFEALFERLGIKVPEEKR